MTKNAIVWTKTSSPPSLEAVRTLRKLGYTVEERNVSLHRPWTIADLKAAIPEAKTVPQIVIDGAAIGGIEAIASLPEAQEKTAARESARTARAASSAARRPQSQQEIKEVKKAARVAAKTARTDAIAARKAAYAEAKANPTNTRDERHAAKNAKIQNTLTRRAAQQPIPPVAPEGYQICAPRTATPEQRAVRSAEKSARKVAEIADYRDASREDRHAKYNAINARIYAKIAEQKAALS